MWWGSPVGLSFCVPVGRRRSRCRGCGATHVLLPAQQLGRRAYAGAVIGRALEAKAAGRGHRAVAVLLYPADDSLGLAITF
jgi:hypothetical protein